MKNLHKILLGTVALLGLQLALSNRAKAGTANPPTGSLYSGPHHREPWFRDDPWMDGDLWYRDASSASIGVYLFPPRPRR